MSSLLPLPRRADLVLTPTSSGVVVFDQRANTVHSLDEACAVVWSALDEHCYEAAVCLATGLAPETVHEALTALAKADLLAGPLPWAPARILTRRQMTRGAAAVVTAPLIVSVTAPAAAQVGSCVPVGGCDATNTGWCCRLSDGNNTLAVCTMISGPGGTVYRCAPPIPAG